MMTTGSLRLQAEVAAGAEAGESSAPPRRRLPRLLLKHRRRHCPGSPPPSLRLRRHTAARCALVRSPSSATTGPAAPCRFSCTPRRLGEGQGRHSSRKEQEERRQWRRRRWRSETKTTRRPRAALTPRRSPLLSRGPAWRSASTTWLIRACSRPRPLPSCAWSPRTRGRCGGSREEEEKRKERKTMLAVKALALARNAGRRRNHRCSSTGCAPPWLPQTCF